ncbi:MAG: GrrA/OscA1 family cyclophane-containing rSAM-modified RiPP [Synechocystis sp.]|nr:GrrA/OscA1 family cyclophane-containing rSAM-modified RiPP [Synechocystis sp.]
MNSTQLGWTAFLVAIASVTTSTPAPALSAETQPLAPNSQPTGIEGRIARIQSTLKNTADQSPTDSTTSDPQKLALGWGNGRGGGTFVNSRRGGWGDGRGGGSFVNVNPWRNGWRDGGGFFNRRWPDGGGFVNRW